MAVNLDIEATKCVNDFNTKALDTAHRMLSVFPEQSMEDIEILAGCTVIMTETLRMYPPKDRAQLIMPLIVTLTRIM